MLRIVYVVCQVNGPNHLEHLQQHAEVVLLPQPRRPAEHPHRLINHNPR